MPWESIGSCGGGEIAQLRMAIIYLCDVCGDPPRGCEIDIMWHEHELGDYPTIGLSWEWDPEVRTVPPWEYINRCEIALAIFDEAVSWSEIDPKLVREKLEETVEERNKGTCQEE